MSRNPKPRICPCRTVVADFSHPEPATHLPTGYSALAQCLRAFLFYI